MCNSDGTVTSVYCHYDGYLGHNGKLLLQHYNDENLARGLIRLGDVYLLGSTVSNTQYYSRETKESNVSPRLHSSLHSESYKNFKQEYNYVYNVDNWYVAWHDYPFELLRNELLSVQ